MTRRERAQVVELLRCAADIAFGGRDFISDYSDSELHSAQVAVRRVWVSEPDLWWGWAYLEAAARNARLVRLNSGTLLPSIQAR